MAQRNLRAAAEVAGRHPERARELEIDDEETARWRDAAETMSVPYDETLGVHPQAEGFTRQVWDLYRKQAVKQADLVLAMFRRGDAFTAEQKARNFAYS